MPDVPAPPGALATHYFELPADGAERLSAELAALIETSQASVEALPAEERSARLAEAFVKVLAGILDIDAQLVEEELMRIFNSSRGSVRDALNELRDAEEGGCELLPDVCGRAKRICAMQELGVTVDALEATINSKVAARETAT